MISYLKGASPWMRFIGIMGFISCGIMILWGISMSFLPALVLQTWEFEGSGLAAGMGALVGIVYIIIAVFTFLPARWLYKTGAKIRSYVRTGADADLEEAFRNNKALWKFTGIITIISLAIIPALIILSVLAAVGTAFM
ncbi:MAG: DUF5362 family protein [Spirochaetales bacterium]|jgi:hypothetical protein|nr:DUF5362 family protein [Spirochaetales bacterium]